MARETAVTAGAGFSYEVGIQTIREQLGRIEALDSKAGTMIAADGVLIGFLLAGNSLLQQIPDVVAAIGLIGVLASLLLALVSFLNRHYRASPSLPATIRLMSAPQEWLRWRLLGNIERAVEVNAIQLARKARFLTGSMTTLLITLSLLGGYAVPEILGGS